jgi:hypothetical protein
MTIKPVTAVLQIAVCTITATVGTSAVVVAIVFKAMGEISAQRVVIIIDLNLIVLRRIQSIRSNFLTAQEHLKAPVEVTQEEIMLTALTIQLEILAVRSSVIAALVSPTGISYREIAVTL